MHTMHRKRKDKGKRRETRQYQGQGKQIAWKIMFWIALAIFLTLVTYMILGATGYIQ